jgi:hypothetical protein
MVTLATTVDRVTAPIDRDMADYSCGVSWRAVVSIADIVDEPDPYRSHAIRTLRVCLLC